MLLLLWLCSLGFARSDSLPVIDLGYEIHQAASFNETGDFYNFSNIRFGAAPIGELRFRAPHPPRPNRSQIQNGSIGRVCPQASPKWFSLERIFIPSYLAGETFNDSTDLSDYPYTPAAEDSRTTEDCLFLDVLVPRKIFQQAKTNSNSSGAAVLVWIYGGGYSFGDKTVQSGAPGLVERSKADGSDGLIYISFNYRLGAFGWLSGPSLERDGTANAGLLDQRLALEWIQKYVHLFGGDPNKVTVFGESAGGGSILHQLTAYGGRPGPLLFQRAVLQSPGFLPLPSRQSQENTTQKFLSILNVTSVGAARRLSSETLRAANAYHIGQFSIYGDFPFTPALDGILVPALPGQLLLSGRFDKRPQVMVGSNANEGLLFTNPQEKIDAGYQQYLTDNLPGIKPQVRDYVSRVLYPPPLNSTNLPYKDDIGRGALTLSDLCFQCNTDYVNRAYNQSTYAYRFSIPPGLHAQDLTYTFFNGNGSTVANMTVALILQDYITSFAKTGIPMSSLGPKFNMHGPDSLVLDLGQDNITTIRDPAASERCRWWQLGRFSP